MRHYRWVQLTQGKRALVDAEDFEKASRFKWYASSYSSTRGAYYLAVRSTGRHTVGLHRFIMGNPRGRDVCFVDRNRTLDCRKSNLRIATQSQNMASRRKQSSPTRSHYKGVSWNRGKWLAQITVRGRQVYVGRFGAEEDAARAYNTTATLHFGEFAMLNVIPPTP